MLLGQGPITGLILHDPGVGEQAFDFAETIGDFFENPVVQLSLQLLLLYIVVIWLATSYSSRAGRRTRS